MTSADRRLTPRRKPRQVRAELTRERILTAAAHVFAEYGYAAGTTNRIAEHARMSIGSLYQYFPNKDAILVELVDDHIEAGTRAVLAAMDGPLAAGPDDPPPLEDLIGPAVRAMVALHGTDRGLHRVLFEEAPRPPEQLARLRALERDLTGQVASLLGAHPEVRVRDVDVAARLVVDAIESLVHRVATDDASGIDDDVLAAEVTRLVVAYLRA